MISTDCNEYLRLGLKHGSEIPFPILFSSIFFFSTRLVILSFMLLHQSYVYSFTFPLFRFKSHSPSSFLPLFYSFYSPSEFCLFPMKLYNISGPFVAGTPVPHQICSYTIYMEQKREGQFRTPTYPGVYPKNMQCQYRFIGRKGQRVRLEFMDFDLFYGGAQ